MYEDQSQTSPTKNEARISRRDERHERERRVLRSVRTRKWLLRSALAVAAAAAIGTGIWYVASRPSLPEEGIIAKRGLHWHSQLAIKIRGVEQEVPTNIGLGAVHNPIHTHEDLGTIHMEMQGLVTEDDIRLARFFEVWGKPFSPTCVLDVCNGPDGTLRMLVNGSESAEFGSYIMQDKDKIEIIYE